MESKSQLQIRLSEMESLAAEQRKLCSRRDSNILGRFGFWSFGGQKDSKCYQLRWRCLNRPSSKLASAVIMKPRD